MRKDRPIFAWLHQGTQPGWVWVCRRCVAKPAAPLDTNAQAHDSALEHLAHCPANFTELIIEQVGR